MAINPQKQAAKKFVEYWTFNRPGSEKSGCQQHWNMLLGEVLGQADLASGIRYEVPVQVSASPSTQHQALSTKYLDAWIPSTRVLIEQKSRGVKLDAPQPGHDNMTPFEQAKFYQFFGLEINDFAVTVAKTAMWISEAKMARGTADILHRDVDFLPLKDYDGIVEGNALRMDWNADKRIATGKNGIAITDIDAPVDFRSAKVHLLDLKRNHAVVENAEGVRFRFTNQVMKALSDKARDQSAGKMVHWAAVGNIERLCKASAGLWNEKPRNGSTDILHYAKHGAAFSFKGSNYIAKITSKAYPGADGVVTCSVEAISVEKISLGE